MYSFKNIFLLVLIGFASSACSESSTSPRKRVMYSMGAQYYIQNQTSMNLLVVFTASGAQSDSTRMVTKDSTEEIYNVRSNNHNPVPSTSFATVKFYKDDSSQTPALVLSPVEDERWKITAQALGESGNGSTSYRLDISDSDLH